QSVSNAPQRGGCLSNVSTASRGDTAASRPRPRHSQSAEVWSLAERRKATKSEMFIQTPFQPLRAALSYNQDV
ncbi:MAG: hypothetical protein ABTQ30_18720, partial [Rhizobiaceae bacterium]